MAGYLSLVAWENLSEWDHRLPPPTPTLWGLSCCCGKSMVVLYRHLGENVLLCTMQSQTLLLHAKDGRISCGMLFCLSLSTCHFQRVEWCLYYPPGAICFSPLPKDMLVLASHKNGIGKQYIKKKKKDCRPTCWSVLLCDFIIHVGFKLSSF